MKNFLYDDTLSALLSIDTDHNKKDIKTYKISFINLSGQRFMFNDERSTKENILLMKRCLDTFMKFNLNLKIKNDDESKILNINELYKEIINIENETEKKQADFLYRYYISIIHDSNSFKFVKHIKQLINDKLKSNETSYKLSLSEENGVYLIQELSFIIFNEDLQKESILKKEKVYQFLTEKIAIIKEKTGMTFLVDNMIYDEFYASFSLILKFDSFTQKPYKYSDKNKTLLNTILNDEIFSHISPRQNKLKLKNFDSVLSIISYDFCISYNKNKTFFSK